MLGVGVQGVGFGVQVVLTLSFLDNPEDTVCEGLDFGLGVGGWG
jgi:hypothetical protein